MTIRVQKTMVKYEIFRLGQGGFPEDLERKLEIPASIALKGHPLSPYVSEQLIPPDIDLVVVRDFDLFYQRIMLIIDSEHFPEPVNGFYLNDSLEGGVHKAWNKKFRKALKGKNRIKLANRALFVSEEGLPRKVMIFPAMKSRNAVRTY